MDSAHQEDLLMQLHQCVALLQRGRFQPARQGGGMGSGQGRLLYLLNKMDGASQTDLVNILDSRPASVSDLIGKLEHLELVDRRRSGNDRRKVNLFLTQKGKETVSGVENARKDLLSDVFAGFTEEEVEQFSFLLAKLLTRLEAINALGASKSGEREESRANQQDRDARKK